MKKSNSILFATALVPGRMVECGVEKIGECGPLFPKFHKTVL